MLSIEFLETYHAKKSQLFEGKISLVLETLCNSVEQGLCDCHRRHLFRKRFGYIERGLLPLFQLRQIVED